MLVTINGEIHVEVEMTADVSAGESASGLKITARVMRGDEWIDVDITSAVSARDQQMALTAIEDEFRQLKRVGA